MSFSENGNILCQLSVRIKFSEDCSSVAEYLPCVHEVLGLIAGMGNKITKFTVF